MKAIELPEWSEVLLEKGTWRHAALYGGRAAAKSRSIATALVTLARQSHERILCGREVQRSIKDSSKRLLDDEIDRLGLRKGLHKGGVFESTETEIRGPNDSLFIFAGLKGNASNIKSLEGVTIAWTEEAQSVSHASIETLIPTIRAPGSRLIWSWNPMSPDDPVDKLFRGENGPPPKTVLRQVNYTENPWFPEELEIEMEWDRQRDYDKYQHVWLGQYRQNSEARVFNNWKVEEFESPNNVDYRLGADFGFSVDPSCLVRCYIDGTRLYIDYEAWGLGVEIRDLPKLFMGVPESEKYWITADSSRPETISHLRQNGFPRIQSALKGARSLEEGVEFLKSYDIIVHPRCKKTIDELSSYQYRTDKLTGQVTSVLEDKNNHILDALRYATEGARRALKGKKMDWLPSIPTLRNAFGR